MNYAELKKKQKERNEQILAAQGFVDVGKELAAIAPKEVEKKKAAPRAHKKRPREDDIPREGTRKSIRTTAMPPAERAEARDADEKASKAEAEALRQKKHEPRDITLETSVGNSGTLIDLLDLTRSLHTDPVIKVLPNDPPIKDIKKEMETLELRDFVKVTPDRAYSVVVHPSTARDVVFMGDKTGNIGVAEFKAERDKSRHWFWKAHNSTVSCLKFPPAGTPGSTTKLYSGSYDATVRVTDLLTGHSQEVIDLDRIDDNEALVHTIDFEPNGQVLWCCDNNGGVSWRDLREPIETVRRWKVCDKKIGCLSLNPANPDLLVTSHLARTMKVWDLQKLHGMPSDFDDYSNCVLAEYPYSKSCTSAYFSRDGKKILSTSYDDQIRLWNVNPKNPSSLTKDFKPFADFHHNNQTGRFVSVFKAQWAGPSSTHFTIGNMAQRFNVYDTTGKLLAAVEDEERLTSVPAVTGSHPMRRGRMYGAHTAGKIGFYTTRL